MRIFRELFGTRLLVVENLWFLLDELEVASKPRIKCTADWGGNATKEGEDEDDK